MAFKRQSTAPRRERKDFDLKAKPADGIFLERKGNHNNWELFKSQFTDMAFKVYGELAKELGADADLNEDFEEPAGGVNSFRYKVEMKRIEILLKKREDWAMDRPKLFGDILCHICIESERIVKEHDGFNAANEAKSPRLLWAIVQETHLTPQHAGDMAMWFQRNRVYNLRQITGQRIEDYSRIFRTEFEKLLALGGQIDQPTAAQVFLISLAGEIFSDKVAELSRDGEIPQTLEAAITLATQWYRTNANARAAMGASTNRASNAIKTEAAFIGTEEVTNLKPANCPICNKKANHTIENCWELPNFCARQQKSKGKTFKKDNKSQSVKSQKPTSSKAPMKQKKATWSAREHTEATAEAAWSARVSYSNDTHNPIIIDSGASISLWAHSDNLIDVTEGPTTTVEGVDGVRVSSTWGTHPVFGRGLVMKDLKVNLISVSQLSKIAEVQYSQEHSGFKAITHQGTYYFDLEDGLYKLRRSAYALLTNHSFTTSQMQKAKEAREFCENLGHVGKDGLIRIIHSGTITNLHITEQDVKRAELLFGPCKGCLIGKGTKSSKNYVPNDDIPPRINVDQQPDNLHADFVFLPGPGKAKNIVFVSVSERTRMIVATRCDSRSAAAVTKAWEEHLSPYKQHGININRVTTDNEATLGASKVALCSMGIKLMQHASSQHEPFVERRIRTIKERMRSILGSLKEQGIELPLRLYWPLMVWAIQGINITPDSLEATTDIRSAREKVTGTRPNAKLLRHNFGECVVYHVDKHGDANLERRNDIGIIVGRNIESGVYKLWNPTTHSFSDRRTFTKTPLPESTIGAINKIAALDRSASTGEDSFMERLSISDTMGGPVTHEDTEDIIVDEPQQQGEPTDATEEQTPTDYFEPSNEVPTQINNNEVPTTQLDNIEIGQPNATEPTTAPVDDISSSPYNLRPRRIQDYSKMQQAFTQLSIKEAESINLEDTRRAIKTELTNLLSYEAFGPAEHHAARVIPSKMFIKIKHKANGDFDKVKARLVAGGHKQEIADSSFSPTVSWSTVQVAIATIVQRDLNLSITDIPSAYLNATRPVTKKIFMRINKDLVKYLLELKPDWAPHVDNDGSLIVLLKKALYGLKESGALWYDHLQKSLRSIGLVPHPIDQCLFVNKDHGVLNLIALVYVDDIMLVAKDKQAINNALTYLESTYGKLSSQHESPWSILGVTITANEKGFALSCPGIINKMADSFGIQGETNSPTPSNYSHKCEGQMLSAQEESDYHSLVMSLLYVAKRCRPDILINAAIYSTKIKRPTKQDLTAARKTLAYLKTTASIGTMFTKSTDGIITLAADASFNCHDDAKSHTGYIIFFGSNPISAKSAKQKTVSKSSMEAELIAMDAGVDDLFYVSEVATAMGYEFDFPMRVLQDNKSAITVLEKGKPTKKRAPIKVKYQYVKEKIQEGSLLIEYVPTELMPADILTKTLHGDSFLRGRARVLNI